MILTLTWSEVSFLTNRDCLLVMTHLVKLSRMKGIPSELKRDSGMSQQISIRRGKRNVLITTTAAPFLQVSQWRRRDHTKVSKISCSMAQGNQIDAYDSQNCHPPVQVTVGGLKEHCRQKLIGNCKTEGIPNLRKRGTHSLGNCFRNNCILLLVKVSISSMHLISGEDNKPWPERMDGARRRQIL